MHASELLARGAMMACMKHRMRSLNIPLAFKQLHLLLLGILWGRVGRHFQQTQGPSLAALCQGFQTRSGACCLLLGAPPAAALGSAAVMRWAVRGRSSALTPSPPADLDWRNILDNALDPFSQKVVIRFDMRLDQVQQLTWGLGPLHRPLLHPASGLPRHRRQPDASSGP